MTKRSFKIATVAVEALRAARPDLFVETDTYAIECALGELAGLPHPRKPSERRAAGAINRGDQLRGKPALNPSGRIPKLPLRDAVPRKREGDEQ